MDVRELKATAREIGSPAHLRAMGQLLGVVYGHNTKATSIALDAREFARVFKNAGRTHLVDLVVGEARALKVLIREVQISPRRHGPVHVDFYRVSLKEKLHADVPVVGVGESPAVKVGLGELHVFSHVLKVECLPADIPEQIDLDLTRLETLDDTLKVSDLVLPAGVTVLADLDEVLAKVAVHKERAADIEDAASEAAAATAASEASAEGESTEDAG